MIEPGAFATRDGKNPDSLAEGRMGETNLVYDELRRRPTRMTEEQPAADPAAAAQALLKVVDADNPPWRVLFGVGFHPMLQQGR